MSKNKFLPMANPDVGVLEAQAAYKTIKSGWISMGKTVLEFESKIKKLLNVKNAIFVNNGTSALHCVLLALRIGRGDEVIVPTLSYIVQQILSFIVVLNLYFVNLTPRHSTQLQN